MFQESQQTAAVSTEDSQAFLSAAKEALEGDQSHLIKSIVQDDKNQVTFLLGTPLFPLCLPVFMYCW